ARSDGESGVHWVLAAIGALLGAALGEAEAIVLGLVAGALLGWQGARIAQLRQRLAALEGRGHVAPPAETAIPASPPPTAAAVRTAAAPAPGATPAAAAARPGDAGPVDAPPPAAAVLRQDPAPAIPVPPAPRQQPSLDARVGRLLRRWFMEGNVPAKLGALITFVGVATVVKLAVDAGWIALPIELRLAGVALAAIAALAWGWRKIGRAHV